MRDIIRTGRKAKAYSRKDRAMYGIMRIEKRKTQACVGIHAENNRDSAERKNFVSSEIDWEKTKDNIYFVKSDNFKTDIEKDLHAHGIDKWRKDAVTFIDGLYTASPDFFQDKKPEEIERYFKDCLEFHKKTYGDHVINAVVHLDEATPHMHVVSVPIVEKTEIDEKLGVPKPTKYSLSAKTLMGGLKDYYARQDRFYEDVTKGYGLERGETRNPEKRKKHLSVLEYKAQEANKELTDKEARLTSIDGEIKKAEDLREEKSDKGLFGRSTGKITMSWDEYRSLQKTATAVEDVKRSEDVLEYHRANFEREKASMQARLDKVAEKEREASEKLAQAQEYLDKESDYIIGTSEGIVKHILGSTSTSREERMEDYLETIKFDDGSTALERFKEEEAMLEKDLLDGIG